MQVAKKEKVIYIVTKRIADIILSVIALIILLPVFLIIGIAIKLDSKGPVFFMQKRIGKDGKTFALYKFRTMVESADKILMKKLKSDEEFKEKYLNYRKIENDDRVTKVGKFLRKTSLDELPQFFNVLKGNMSLVGPRPYLKREKKDMGDSYNYIIKCKPGITGLWQVSGRSKNTFKERLNIDVKYYNNRNLWYDTKILFKTVNSVLKKEGAV